MPTILGSAVPTIVVSRAARDMPNINAMTTIVFARLAMSLFRPFLCYLITIVSEQSVMDYVFPMPSMLLASSGVAIARRKW